MKNYFTKMSALVCLLLMSTSILTAQSILSQQVKSLVNEVVKAMTLQLKV
jgi:hypothetical protein